MKFYFAEVLNSAFDLLCAMTGHARGCMVSNWWLNSWLGSRAFHELTKDRYPEYRGQCDGCPTCGRKYKQTVPNPYYASEKELAEWARWYGSDVSPEDYAEFWKDQPHTHDCPPETRGGGSVQTYVWSYCAKCGWRTDNTTTPRTA
jgi:hypothetical protein